MRCGNGQASHAAPTPSPANSITTHKTVTVQRRMLNECVAAMRLSTAFTEAEWKTLCVYDRKRPQPPKTLPTLNEAIRLLAELSPNLKGSQTYLVEGRHLDCVYFLMSFE